MATSHVLRQAAEDRILHSSPGNPPERPATEILHELQVHQIELEMQNEELRRAQVSLEEARDRYVDFYDFAPSGYLTLTSGALIADINFAGASILGKERNKLVNRSLLPFIDQGCRDTWFRHFKDIARHGGKQRCELTLLRGDGSRLSVQFDSLRLVTSDNATLIRVALTDISELKSMEAALRGSELMRHMLEQREIVQTSLDGFWMVRSSDGRILEVNDTYCSMVGYSPEEILSMSISDLEAFETPAETQARFKVISERGYDRFETRHRHKLGHLVYLEVSVSRSTAHGGVNFAFFRDISERKRLEESLTQSQMQLKAFVQQAPIGIAMFDRDMNYLAASGRWITEYGQGHANLVGLNHYAVHPDIPEKWKSIYQQALAGAALEDANDFWLRHDGSKRWLRWAALPWTNESSEIGGIIVMADDMTNQKLLELEVQEQIKELAQLQKLQVAIQTAAAIAHEINQPLVSITSYSNAALMLMNAEKPDLHKIRKAVDGSEQQALRAGQSIRELLDFLSRREYQVDDFDLNEEIRKSINTANFEYERQFKSVLGFENGLPSVRANRMHVQKVLLNLIHNGIDAMQNAGLPAAAITVTVTTSRDDDYAQVTVQDNGPGVRAQDMQRLFEPFFTTKANGIGMGLSVSRSLVEENGGRLWFEQPSSAGAIFHFTLPFAR